MLGKASWGSHGACCCRDWSGRGVMSDILVGDVGSERGGDGDMATIWDGFDDDDDVVVLIVVVVVVVAVYMISISDVIYSSR